MNYSKRVQLMSPSATLVMTAKANALKLEGKPIISFSDGEPDFDTPAVVQEMAFTAIKTGKTHYTTNSGIPELRKAVARYYKRHFDLDVDISQVVVGCGAKSILYEALGCLIDPGDEVVIPVPAWVSYVEQVKLFDGVPVIVDTSDTNYLPNMQRLEATITDRTRAILINSPNNPTGVVYDEKTLRGIVKLAKKYDFIIIFDEIYERIIYSQNKHYNILQLCPEVADRTVIVNGVSKAFAMTGWRLGYGIGPKELMSKINGLQGHITSNASSVSQWAAVAALDQCEVDTENMVAEFAKRKDLIFSLLSEMPYIKLAEPQGAFYAWFDIHNVIGKVWNGKKITNDSKFCELLLEKKLVGSVMGSAFMAPGYVRLSYASSQEEIKEGMKRLKEFLEEIE